MTAPATFPQPRMNQSAAGNQSRASALAAADIIVALGDYTGGAAEDMFTLTSHGLVTGDHVHLVDMSALGALTSATGQGTRYFVKYLTSSTFQLCSDSAAATVVENTADGTIVLVKGRIPTSVVEQVILPYIIVADGDFTGGTTEDMFVPRPSTGFHGLVETDTLKLLYKSAAGVITGIAADTTVFAKSVTVAAFELAATSGGADIENTADGLTVWLKTS
jgi:hypothetical protein